jgi:hypothetical protein
MKARALTGLVGVVLFGAFFSGCKDEPPPPPMPEASAAATGTASGTGTFQLPAYSQATTKRFRVELCFYGAYGLKLTRDAYLASLGGKEPSEALLPSFGKLPELDGPSATPLGTATAWVSPATSAAPKTTAAPKDSPAPTATSAASANAAASVQPLATAAGLPPNAAAMERLAYLRYLGSCAQAAHKEENAPVDEALDKALADFEPLASNLNRQLMAAQRYYASKQYVGDKFERGKLMHREFVAGFDALGAKSDAFETAFLAWEATLTKPSEKLDKSAETAYEALQHARALGAALLGEKPNGDALKTALEGVTRSREALETIGKNEPKAAHPRELVGRLRRLMDAGAKAQAALSDKGSLKEATYLVMMELAALVESNHRALGQLLRQSGQTRPGSGLTTLRPGANGLPGIRPNMRLRTGAEPGADRTDRSPKRPNQEEHPE